MPDREGAGSVRPFDVRNAAQHSTAQHSTAQRLTCMLARGVACSFSMETKRILDVLDKHLAGKVRQSDSEKSFSESAFLLCFHFAILWCLLPPR
jgi:hypothetical protein